MGRTTVVKSSSIFNYVSVSRRGYIGFTNVTQSGSQEVTKKELGKLKLRIGILYRLTNY